ncbi:MULTISPECIES: indole-3-glycerol phosphate synthase TrpC [unclassified Enterococcus]|uniref:indole-3-glycerol phosphate synthase TrpC n=1 Tax=unclassified Enterococcus TaxID=2608891 RepID=UPI00155374A8|nr:MULTISPECIES: indole-3-glycerol phosphate synthase TrpC [unclassified Enterococcus]MBS7577420.1 indole-3-glycerol phosphate synthase TrpC [Enterococcus sp. MMGLQ5-2]MBS7584827.1 indole-3-glycerol phosphate synthase TrpC [Enterococcus sp. MMGLQ5-1]NPD12682.1 indole-3-glycerol phosphate synthase TrpC [Enterococcus sp. MMGLQ5-1]NPD37254.1 indole-3-glycerol phosphate synthase TrpC [Enterococcus sp. MMGLQ5-2]
MNFLEQILSEKAKEVAEMPLEMPGKVRKTTGFVRRLQEHPEYLQVIGEVKRASPSLGAINMAVDVLQQAKSYEIAGVSAISVLTDPVFFKGNIEDLKLVAKNVDLPVLNKDFIIDKKQINRAVNAGATIILLIVAALEPEQLRELFNYATACGLEVLVEVHNQAELAIAHEIKANLIGINNRNLKTFEVSLQTSLDLVPNQLADCFYISESGIKSATEAALVAKHYRAVLVGEALMKDGNPKKAAKALQVLRDVD